MEGKNTNQRSVFNLLWWMRKEKIALDVYGTPTATAAYVLIQKIILQRFWYSQVILSQYRIRTSQNNKWRMLTKADRYFVYINYRCLMISIISNLNFYFPFPSYSICTYSIACIDVASSCKGKTETRRRLHLGLLSEWNPRRGKSMVKTLINLMKYFSVNDYWENVFSY